MIDFFMKIFKRFIVFYVINYNFGFLIKNPITFGGFEDKSSQNFENQNNK